VRQLKRAMRLRRAAVAMLAAIALPAAATQFPEGIGWHLEAEPWWSYQSNPFRFSDANDGERHSDMITGALLRGGLKVPLLSERTRLELSGTTGHARYAHYRQLDHNPAHFDGALRWHAGKLFSGNVRYRYGKSLYYNLNRTYPERDMVTTRRKQAEINLHVSPRLIAPRVSVWRETTGYEYAEHHMLFDRRSRHVEVSGTWLGTGRSSFTLGWQHAAGDYPNRTPEWVEQVGSRFKDDAYFADLHWDYSVKTQLAARVGYQQRRYPGLAGRDASQWTTLLRAGWDYSPKTRFDLFGWHQAYPNDEDPEILYATVTGARFSVRWRPTVKTMFSFAAAYERQNDTPAVGNDARTSRLLRIGPRFEWRWHRRAMLFVDAWHDRNMGASAFSRYRNTVVRIGVVIQLDNRWEPPVDFFWRPECQPPHYIEAMACQSFD